jgi:hypothetical protein
MASLIKQGEARIVTKNGEVFVNIALELTIKLEGTNLQGPVSASGGASSPSVAPQEDDKVKWEIPEFAPGKIKFGN